MKMRIITRPDFDGVVCAVLLKTALDIEAPVLWAQPNDMQRGLVDVKSTDAIANLPFHPDCALWFDHHYSNRMDRPIKGAFKIAPSAAGVVFEYFRDQLPDRLAELVHQADKIDAADLNLDEILNPQNYPYVLLSMTISGRDTAERYYWDRLVDLLAAANSIQALLQDGEVQRRCERVISENREYEHYLKSYTRMQEAVSVTDFRPLMPAPDGNRFLVYSLFPRSMVNVKIYHEAEKTVVKVGHSILNRACRVNVGKLLVPFGGGGHRGAGACRFDRAKADDILPQIIDVLVANQPNE